MSQFTTLQQNIISQAIGFIEASYHREDLQATSPDAVRDFCRLQIGHSENEQFGVLFLDSQHQLIEFNVMFTGTIDSASVYPREIAKEALRLNAAALIITHNHPSGVVTPSEADRRITQRITQALTLFDMRVLDHIVVSAVDSLSFAECGYL